MSQGTILVTGTNGGLGSAIVERIVRDNKLSTEYTGLFTVRKVETAAKLKQILASAPSHFKYDTVSLDLSSLAKVRKTAADINQRVATGAIPPIRALILNAAYQDHDKIAFTDDGYETMWHVNYLANQLLALLLLQSMDKEKGRILVIGSWSHDIEDKRNDSMRTAYADYKELFPGPEPLAKGTWSPPGSGPGWDPGYRRYGASKQCAVMLMHELAERLAQDPELSNVTLVGLDPGGMASDLIRRGSFGLKAMIWVVSYLAGIITWFSPNGTFRTPWKSAGDAVQLCFGAETTRGRALYRNGSEDLETSKESRNAAKRKALWAYGLEAAAITKEDTVLQNWQ